MVKDNKITKTDDDGKKQIKQSNIIIIFIIAIVIIIPITYAISLPSESTLSIQNTEFISATDFTSVDVLTGEEISLSQFKGDIILLNFVNYGCNQRLNEIVSDQLLVIKSLTRQRNDFTPVSVFCGCCPIETLRSFANENELNWPWILDSDNSIVNNYYDYVGKYGYPTLVFINENLDIIKSSGFIDTSELSSKLDTM